MSLYIVTDSAADLPEDIIQEYKLDVVPMTVTIEGKDYLDGVSVKPKELFDRMRAGASVKTAQINSYEFVEKFEPYAQRGDSVLYICFSSGLSGTYNSANIAKEELLEKYPEFDLTIIDSRCASVGFGLVVYKALVMHKKNVDQDIIIEATKYNAAHMEHIFTVDDLEYLFRGGRVSRTAAFVGGLLNIKPILDVNDEGKLIPIEKIRGRQKSIKRMVELVGDRGRKLSSQVIGINHGDDLAAAQNLMDQLKEAYGCNDFLLSYVGCAVGAHSGPGTLSVFFLDSDSPYEKYLQ